MYDNDLLQNSREMNKDNQTNYLQLRQLSHMDILLIVVYFVFRIWYLSEN